MKLPSVINMVFVRLEKVRKVEMFEDARNGKYASEYLAMLS